MTCEQIAPKPVVATPRVAVRGLEHHDAPLLESLALKLADMADLVDEMSQGEWAAWVDGLTQEEWLVFIFLDQQQFLDLTQCGRALRVSCSAIEHMTDSD